MMKFLFLLLLVPVVGFGQEYKQYADFKYLKDTLLINGVKIKKGDTLRLGAGSGSDNSFSYVFTRPTLMNGANTQPLSNKFDNSFLILAELKEINFAGNVAVFPMFYVGGNKRQNVNVNFSKALKFKEIIL